MTPDYRSELLFPQPIVTNKVRFVANMVPFRIREIEIYGVGVASPDEEVKLLKGEKWTNANEVARYTNVIENINDTPQYVTLMIAQYNQDKVL